MNQRLSSSLGQFAVAVAAVMLAAAVVTWSAIDHARQQRTATVARVQADLVHMAQVTGKTMDMLVQAADLGLGDVAENVRNRVFSDHYNPLHFHDALRRKLVSLPQVSRIAVFDDSGEIESDSNRQPAAAIDIAATQTFRSHRDQWLDLAVAPPGHGLVGFNPDSLLISRRIDDADQNFRGAVVAEFSTIYLHDSLWTSIGSAAASMAVIDRSGKVIVALRADLSEAPPQPGTHLADNVLFKDLPSGFGLTSGSALHRNNGHTFAVHQMSHVPLRVVLVQKDAALLEAWRQTTLIPALLIVGGSWMMAGLIIVVLAIQAAQTLRVRRELQESEARLNQLVMASPAVIYGANVADDFAPTYLSANLEAVLGYDAKTALASPSWWIDTVHPDDRGVVLAGVDGWLTAGANGIFRHRYRFRAADGCWRWLEDQVVAVRHIDGTVQELVGSLVDVSEAISGAERLAKIARSVPGMIYQFHRRADGSATFPYCNDGIRNILGLTPAEVAAEGNQVFDAVHPADRQAVLDSVEQSRATLTEWSCEFRVVHPERGEIWISGHASPEAGSDGDGSVVWHGFLSEITLRKAAQTALQVSEERLALILHGTNDAPWDWDLVNNTMYYAPRWWQMVGYAVDELTGGPRLWQDLLHPEDAGRMKAYVAETFADPGIGAFTTEFRLRHKDGHYVPVLSRGVIVRDPAGTAIRLAGANTDLTERRALQHALADSERLYRSIFENVSDAIFLVTVDPENGYRYLRNNPAHQATTGLQLLEGVRPHDVLPADVADHAMERYDDCLVAGQPTLYEETLDLPAGQRIWSTTLNPVRDEFGNITLLVGISRDITEAKRAERLIRESEERLATYFEVAPLGIYVTDARGRYQEVNAAACTQSGFTVDDFRAMTIMDYVAAESRADGAQHFAHVREHGITHGEMKFRRKDGSWFWAMIVAGPLPDGRIIGFVEDITERKRMEESLKRSNADLEQFAYVASHDLRQPLRMVNSYLQLVARRLAPVLDDETREFIGFARDGAQRMDHMLVALLEFSRIGRTGQPKAPVALDGVLDEALRFLGPTIEETRAQIEIAGTWPTVEASRDEMVRLFQNLIDNAMKYRPATVTPVIHITVGPIEDGWKVSVRDNGIGIAPDQTSRLFKVFQRLHTREEFEGTGIGLAVCRKIVERHEGRIWAESEGPGTGTTFAFTLPARVVDTHHRRTLTVA